MSLFKIVINETPKGAIAGTNEIYWVVAKNMKEVGEKYPKAESITLITNNLITLNGKTV
jgi:hypothetical protein